MGFLEASCRLVFCRDPDQPHALGGFWHPGATDGDGDLPISASLTSNSEREIGENAKLEGVLWIYEAFLLGEGSC